MDSLHETWLSHGALGQDKEGQGALQAWPSSHTEQLRSHGLDPGLLQMTSREAKGKEEGPSSQKDQVHRFHCTGATASFHHFVDHRN